MPTNSTAHEYRTRVTFNLPIKNSKQERAIKAVIGYLQTLRHESLGVSGFTHSDLFPAVFQGYWWDEKEREFVEERICLFIVVDYKIGASDESSETGKVEELKTRIMDAYSRYGAEQEEVWIVTNRIVRYS